MELGFRGTKPLAGFDPARTASDRRIRSDGREEPRATSWAAGPGGRCRLLGLAAATGPLGRVRKGKWGAERAEQAAGRIGRWTALIVKFANCFILFQKHLFEDFCTVLIISIQF